MTSKRDRDTPSEVFRFAGKHWIASALRALVFLLVLPLATAGALPAWALLVGVEDAHVCHCAADHQECVCPKCHPDQADDFALSTESIKILKTPKIAEQLRNDGFEVLANGPDGMRKRIEDEVPKWRDVVAKAGIKPV